MHEMSQWVLYELVNSKVSRQSYMYSSQIYMKCLSESYMKSAVKLVVYVQRSDIHEMSQWVLFEVVNNKVSRRSYMYSSQIYMKCLGESYMK